MKRFSGKNHLKLQNKQLGKYHVTYQLSEG